MVRLYIIRHADPDYDTNKAQGGSLTTNGMKEAAALAHYLKNEGITHAYTSPLGRAKLTAELALREILQFNCNEHDATKSSNCTNNFDLNVGIEPWSRELSSWRQISHLQDFPTKQSQKKAPAIWDFPSPIIRNQLQELSQGDSSTPGWKEKCSDYSNYAENYKEFCSHLDEFLSRHGIIKNEDECNYYLSRETANDPILRKAKIALFCHGGSGLTMVAHLLKIPLPLVHGGMWLAPSSVTTILFDEYTGPDEKGAIVVTPRMISMGSTNHLSVAGLSISNSSYEDDFERPSGIKHNFE